METANQDRAGLDQSSSKWRAIVIGELPYLAILVLSLLGVAYTSFSQTPVRMFWIFLGPLIGLVCVATRWSETTGSAERIRLIWTQALHWVAVLAAIELMSIADVSRMMNADASALSTLTLLALGTFIAGVHIASWRIALVGVVLGLGVPAVAWVEQSAFLILLILVGLAGVIAPIVLRLRR